MITSDNTPHIPVATSVVDSRAMKDRRSTGLIIKPSNIRIWIHQRDLGRLQRVLWEGHGAKLRTETCNHPRIKRFLEAVPHLMGYIRDIHSSAVNNDLIILTERTSSPIPSVILSSKDANSLTALHKAAGLGHLEVARYIANTYPPSLAITDTDGRTPLHFSAILKDGEEMYNMLIDAGAEESTLDNKQKAAAYYRTRPNEIDTKSLQVVPEAPRTSSAAFPVNWDWGLLTATSPVAEEPKKSKKKTDTVFGTTPVEEKKAVEQLIENNADENNEIQSTKEEREEIAAIPNGHSPQIEEIIPDVQPQSNEVTENVEENSLENESEDKELENYTENQNLIENQPDVLQIESEDEPDENTEDDVVVENTQEIVLEDTKDIKSDTPESQKIGVIEGIVNGEDEVETLNNDENGNDEPHRVPDLTEMVETGNMEQLAAIVLNGEGDQLIGQNSDNPEIQAFLDNVPIYMAKIRRIHLAARDGSLRELQAALDRRKFAIAKDASSPGGASPLHVAIIFGNTSIVRYLAGRFPETVHAVDENGRTPLHYAATLADNGHYFNLLIHLGADIIAKDNFDNIADLYMTQQDDFSHKNLLQNFGADAEVLDEMLQDKVPNDCVSARRDLDDEDMLVVLERCYKLLQGRRVSNAGQTDCPTGTLLANCLKRHTFDIVKTRLTSFDHNLYDVVWPSVKKLPADDNIIKAIQQDFPFGITAPDQNSYSVFREFFYPVLKEIHCVNHSSDLIQPMPTFLVSADDLTDPQDFDYNLDSSGKWILSGVVEITRNLDGFNFPKSLNIGDLEEVERELTTVLMSHDIIDIICFNLSEDEFEELGAGTYYTLNEVLENSLEIKSELEEAGLMIPLWNLDDSDRLHGKHWPYGRGVFVSSQRNMAAWINVLDHLRLIIRTSKRQSGNIGNIYSMISKISYELNKTLIFSRNKEIGFVSTRPDCVGNTLKFRLNIKLTYLCRENDNLKQLCSVRGLTVTDTLHSGIVSIGNQQCLGVTETQTFEDFATAVNNILQLEKDLAMHNSLHIAQMFVNMFRRKRSGLVANQ